jgi:antibiotic biosynthesis monooxygenase (ABM) superfamily enzyme
MAPDATPSLPVTVVVSRRARAGREGDLEQWAQGVCAAAAQFPGHLGAQIHQPSVPENADLVIVFGFEAAGELAEWERSDVRAEWLRRAEPLSDGGQQVHTVQTLAGLFTAPGRPMVPPPRWKSAVVICLALYPLSLLVALLIAPHLGGLPVAGRSLVSTALVVPLMVWVAVPAVSRLLRRWLAAKG